MRRHDAELIELGKIRRSLHAPTIVLAEDKRLIRDPLAIHDVLYRGRRVTGQLLGVDLMDYNLSGAQAQSENDEALPGAPKRPLSAPSTPYGC